MFMTKLCHIGSGINWIQLNYKNALHLRLANLSCSSVIYAYKDNNKLAKQARKLKTLMSGSKKKLYSQGSAAPKWIEKTKLGTSEFLKPKEAKNPRRVSVLNAVLLEAITDVLSTGEICNEFVGLGIEITRVKVNVDFSIVNVFWVCSLNVDDTNIEKLLSSNAGKIRTYLCSTHVLGNVPLVKFVKDRLQRELRQVEYLLSIADFGPEVAPECDPVHKQTEVSSEGAQHFMGLKDSHLENVEMSNKNVPELNENSGNNTIECIADPSIVNNEMRMDIYGLRHDEMMRQVIQNMSRARAEHRKFPGEVDVPKELQPRKLQNVTDSQPSVGMDIKQYLDQKNRLLKSKLKSRRKQLMEMRNTQIMEDDFQDENCDPSEENYEYEEFLDEEDYNYNHENYSDKRT